jgi:Xaa-Pro aminopeptidase
MSNQARCEKVLAKLEADCLLVSNPENRRYLSGFTGSTGLFLLSPTRRALVADGRYWAQIEQECPDLELIKFRNEEFSSLFACAAHHLAGDSGRLAYESRHLTVADSESLSKELPSGWTLTACPALVEEVRQVKDAAELEVMRRAAQIADRALRNALEHLQAGVRERDFCLELEFQMQKLGARKPAFDSIVASGINGAFPHAGVTERVIESKELLTLDFGCYFQGYNSDITRTVWVGHLGPEEARIYTAVREAQAQAVAAARPGISCKELDAVARQSLAAQGLAEYFTHGLGHGIGLCVHELPGVRSVSEVVLQEGMVITIEPGVYIPGHTGCRVEDSVVITASGCDKLTRSPYQEIGQTHPLEALGG